MIEKRERGWSDNHKKIKNHGCPCPVGRNWILTYLQIIQKHIQDRQDKHVLRNAQRKDLSCTCTFVCECEKCIVNLHVPYLPNLPYLPTRARERERADLEFFFFFVSFSFFSFLEFTSTCTCTCTYRYPLIYM